MDQSVRWGDHLMSFPQDAGWAEGRVELGV